MNFPRLVPRRGLLAPGLLCASIVQAQPDFPLNAAPVAPAAADPVIARALQTIKPARIEETIKTLVGFGARSTLSSMERDLPPGQGGLVVVR